MPIRTQTRSQAPHRRAELRRELEQRLRTDSELEALCVDYFPGTQRLLTAGMDRQQKQNLLLAREAPERIAAALGIPDREPEASDFKPHDVAIGGSLRTEGVEFAGNDLRRGLGVFALVVAVLGILGAVALRRDSHDQARSGSSGPLPPEAGVPLPHAEPTKEGRDVPVPIP